MPKDWTGNANSVFKIIGASNHSDKGREINDYYATDPAATEWLCEIEQFTSPILEPSCGEGHISEQLKKHGYDVTSRDLIDRGYGEVSDFFTADKWDGDIITNPPYSFAKQFVEKALDIIPEGHKVAMFLKLTFLEGKGRRTLFEKHPPIRVWVSSSRLICGKNGTFNKSDGSSTAYAWFIWQKGFKGHPEIHWFN